MKTPQAHLVTGISTVIVFLGTGVYLAMGFPELYHEDQAIRFLYRANHVYLLLSGLLNIVIGLYGVSVIEGWRSKLQSTGSWLLLVSAPLFFAAFILEPPQASPMRPLTLLAAFACFLGVIAHVVARLSKTRSAQP